MSYQSLECLWCGRARTTECCDAEARRTKEGWLLCTKCHHESEVSCECDEEEEHRASLRRTEGADDGPYGGDGPDD